MDKDRFRPLGGGGEGNDIDGPKPTSDERRLFSQLEMYLRSKRANFLNVEMNGREIVLILDFPNGTQQRFTKSLNTSPASRGVRIVSIKDRRSKVATFYETFKYEVDEIAKLLNFSATTIYKDLDVLEAEGRITKRR